MCLATVLDTSGWAAYAESPSKPEITRKEILNAPLEGLKGYDGVMYVTDIPPGMAAPRHSHPGYEFNYILKGSVSYQPDGQKAFTLNAGQGTYNPANHIHKVWNPSKTEPAQLVAVLIKETGKPLAVPAP
ncbi:MAG: cupin domain-containing protein [Pseudomonadota bacterium]